MDEKKIQAFLTVVKLGSINKAAERLDYTQPALTQMMNSLERDLGCRLLSRGHGGVKLTQEGEALLPLLKDISGSMQKLRKEITRLTAQEKKTIRIGAYPSITKSWLSKIIREFRKKYPDISIELCVGGYETEEWLVNGAVDLAFVDENVGTRYHWIPLMQDPYYAVVSINCPLSKETEVSLSKLSQYPFILSEIHELRSFAQENGLERGLHINATDDASLLSLVELGMGVSILPSTSLKNHSDQIAALKLTPTFSRTLGMACRESLSTDAKTFIHFTKEVLEKKAPNSSENTKTPL